MTQWWNPINDNPKTNHNKRLPFGAMLNSLDEVCIKEDFMKEYQIVKNFICEGKGPGGAIKVGEWYLTTCPRYKGEEYSVHSRPKPGNAEWAFPRLPMTYLSYVISPRHTIFIRLDTLERIGETQLKHENWENGTKEGWRKKCSHWKVPKSFISKGLFINWPNNPPQIGGGA